MLLKKQPKCSAWPVKSPKMRKAGYKFAQQVMSAHRLVDDNITASNDLIENAKIKKICIYEKGILKTDK